MIPPRIAFKISMSHYANHKHYRRAQNAYLLLLLLLIIALWPGSRAAGGPTYLSLTVFLTQRLIPIGFAVMQLRLGFGLDHSADGVPPERLPAPHGLLRLTAVVAAELLHVTTQWALQAPLVVVALAAAGLTPVESLQYLTRLLAIGSGARCAGLIARVVLRPLGERLRTQTSTPEVESPTREVEPETTYSRSSGTVSR